MLFDAKRPPIYCLAIIFVFSVVAILLETQLLLSFQRNGDLPVGAVSVVIQLPNNVKFYILEVPEITTWLLGNYTEIATNYYKSCLNEEQAEVWLHRGFERLLPKYRTRNASTADVVIIPGYLHFNHFLLKKLPAGMDNGRRSGVPYTKNQWIEMVRTRLIANKRHVVAIPTWNPTRGREIGIQILVQTLQETLLPLRSHGDSHDVASSLGFERNNFWQRMEPRNIIPIPYVVKPTLSKFQLIEQCWRRPTIRSNVSNPDGHNQGVERIPKSVFYVGNNRKHGVEWGGCNRTALLGPLMIAANNSGHNRHPWYVRLDGLSMLSQEEYNQRMLLSDICLIVCGDTPTSRSLSSAMLHGCIPLRIGSRWRGLCDPPCHNGWGWSVTHNLSHLPFANCIEWNQFPEVDEAMFLQNPPAVLDRIVKDMDCSRKSQIRKVMQKHQMAWVYGWGDPVTSNEFGDAVLYAWESIVHHLFVSKHRAVTNSPA
jgi:hypothetical protein